MSYIAGNIICDAPAGRLEGAAAYRAFIGPFAQIVIRSEMIAAFGDAETALLMYDTETVPVKSAPGAECVTVKDGKITYNRFIFDRAPFDAARAASNLAGPATREPAATARVAASAFRCRQCPGSGRDLLRTG